MDYDTAIAVFAARGRLGTHDETGAVILVNGEEKLLTPAQVTSSAAMIVRADPDTQQVYASGQDDETGAEYSLPAELEGETRSCQECTRDLLPTDTYYINAGGRRCETCNPA